jgi:DNA-binding XRE family transcriptional regulator
MSDDRPPRKPRKRAASPPSDSAEDAEFWRQLERYLERQASFMQTANEFGKTSSGAAKVVDLINEFFARAPTDPVLAELKRLADRISENRKLGEATITTALSRPIEARLAEIFGDNLRLARLELRLSQQDLSDLSGISKRHIGMIERGGNVTLATIEALAPHVGRTAFELLAPRTSRR